MKIQKKKDIYIILYKEERTSKKKNSTKKKSKRILVGLSQMIQRHFLYSFNFTPKNSNLPAIKIHQRPNKTLMVLPYQYPQRYFFLVSSSGSVLKESAKRTKKRRIINVLVDVGLVFFLVLFCLKMVKKFKLYRY